MGRVFARASPRGGHQFCQHYLDGMFPLERGADGEFVGALEEGNHFMESEVSSRRRRDNGEHGLREGDIVDGNAAAADGAGDGDHDGGVGPEGQRGQGGKGRMKVKGAESAVGLYQWQESRKGWVIFTVLE